MRFEKMSPEKLRIPLTSQDMPNWDITYRQMDYGDEKTRILLRELLGLAEQKTGFVCPDHSRLLIELFPTAAGGCTVSFTLIEPVEEIKCCVYGFYGLEPLAECAAKAVDQSFCPHPQGCCCSLYRMQDSYRILCRPASFPAPCMKLLDEYGYPAGEGELAAAYAAEHGSLIASPDALARIAKYLR